MNGVEVTHISFSVSGEIDSSLIINNFLLTSEHFFIVQTNFTGNFKVFSNFGVKKLKLQDIEMK